MTSTYPYGIFEPDALLPLQWAKQFQRQLTGEQRLMLAVLDDAVWCVQRYGPERGHGGTVGYRARRLFAEVEDWMGGRTVGLITFEACCELIGAEPGAVAAAVLTPWGAAPPAAAAVRAL